MDGDIAARCRLTERAVQKIISDLEQDGVEALLSTLAQHDDRREHPSTAPADERGSELAE